MPARANRPQTEIALPEVPDHLKGRLMRQNEVFDGYRKERELLVKDLYRRGYRRAQLARALRLSDGAVHAILMSTRHAPAVVLRGHA